MSEEQVVTYELEGEIALVGLNRPDKRNCFNPDVMKALLEAVVRAGEEAKCGIIFGHGDNFCAGLDLRWAAENWKNGRSQRLPFPFNRNTYFEAMARGNIPFIAALHGATLGGGLETNPHSSRCPRERAASSSAAAARFAWRGLSGLPACRT
jgi:enoyl-CoA hydratase/carnithine racemase